MTSTILQDAVLLFVAAGGTAVVFTRDCASQAIVVSFYGLLLAGDVNDQIHYLAPGTLIGSVAIAFAVLLHEGFSQVGVKAILIMILLIISNPVLSHATARAVRVRKQHQLRPTVGEHIPFAKENK